MEEKEILKIENLSIQYKTDLETVYAVNDISFSLKQGETMGLVGETGAGKTTTALGILGLLPERTARITSGEILFDGDNVCDLTDKQMERVRGEKVSMIFQDPMTALNPVLSVGDQIGEALYLHNEKELSKKEINQRVEETLELVGIPKERKNEYPHQFSGGMRQRVVIAIALVCNPLLLIADEPTTALDVTIQAQILSMICDLQRRYGTSVIMITHDLGVVAETCDKVGIMYAGEIVEYGSLEDIFSEENHHPYTVGLFGSIPSLTGEEHRLHPIEGLMPDPTALPEGCKFAPRCEHCMEICKTKQPPVWEKDGHQIRCHLFSQDEIAVEEPKQLKERLQEAEMQEAGPKKAEPEEIKPEKAEPEGIKPEKTEAKETKPGKAGQEGTVHVRASSVQEQAQQAVATRNEVLFDVRNLKKYFRTGAGQLHAVDDVSFTIQKGMTLGVVGESGCGKSTLGRTLICLEKATEGEIFFGGQDLTKLKKKELNRVRPKMQMIFQDPYGSLNGRMTLRQLIAEPLIVNKVCGSRSEMDDMIDEMMETVGLARRLDMSYPHELDGGRRQRIGIARALILDPEFVVCDEPVSALDVSIQAQILNLLMDLQEQMGLTYIFITHDLSVVRHISDQIMVMYLGKCVETAPAKEIFLHPAHPYTRALLAAIPIPSVESKHKHRELLQGEVTSPVNPKPGCRFAARCPYATNACRQEEIPLREISPGHLAACTLC